MRLMGNRAHHAQPNTTEVLTDTSAIVDNLEKDPGMPKASDGRTVVEILGQADADIQRFIIGNTIDNADYIPGVSPYMSSRANSQSPQSGSPTATATARCANGDLACTSGVGVQQSSLPELGDAARNAIADGMASTSRMAGVVAAGATAAAAHGGVYGRPATAVAAIATLLGYSADTLEQLARPDPKKFFFEQIAIGVPVELLTQKFPLYAPAINEMAEQAKRLNFNGAKQ